jgi:hypothetical protein
VTIVRCNCCDAETAIGRKVKLRPLGEPAEPSASPDAAADLVHQRAHSFQWAVVCLACYRALDNATGLAEIDGKSFNMAGSSREEKAAILDEAQYQQWQRRLSGKLWLD